MKCTLLGLYNKLPSSSFLYRTYSRLCSSVRVSGTMTNLLIGGIGLLDPGTSSDWDLGRRKLFFFLFFDAFVLIWFSSNWNVKAMSFYEFLQAIASIGARELCTIEFFQNVGAFLRNSFSNLVRTKPLV